MIWLLPRYRSIVLLPGDRRRDLVWALEMYRARVLLDLNDHLAFVRKVVSVAVLEAVIDFIDSWSEMTTVSDDDSIAIKLVRELWEHRPRSSALLPARAGSSS